MLKQEVVRANKKITETKTKTKEMQNLQKQNDSSVISKAEQNKKREEAK